MNNTNRNESFINTASKLLERVKQQQQSMSFDESTPKITTTTKPATTAPTATTIISVKQNSLNGQTAQTQAAVKNIKC